MLQKFTIRLGLQMTRSLLLVFSAIHVTVGFFLIQLKNLLSRNARACRFWLNKLLMLQQILSFEGLISHIGLQPSISLFDKEFLLPDAFSIKQ